MLLLIATALALLIENSPFYYLYDILLSLPVEVRVGTFAIAKPLLLWINDGLMAVFFCLVGLEIKREVIDGELSEPSRVVMPVIGAIGGMAFPAIIYSLINMESDAALRGWAIPSATDIAFALGVLALLGNRVPYSLKVFLMTLAIVDDLGAIIIIAIFYTTDLSVGSLLVACGTLALMVLLNRRKVLGIAPYALLGVVLWVAVLKSGVHATLAGVLTAFCIPYIKQPESSKTMVEVLEHDLAPVVSYGILPLFAFANTGISLEGLGLSDLLHPVPLGIAAGLFFGNQLGIMSCCWLAVRAGFAKLPAGATWKQMYGVSLLCGIGFTMSLFISSLAFVQGEGILGVVDRLGILVGSTVSGVAGYVVLRMVSREKHSPPD